MADSLRGGANVSGYLILHQGLQNASLPGNLSLTTINNLTPTALADGFSIAGGTTSRTLTIAGANKTINGTGTGLTLTGAYNLTFIMSAATSLTLPTSGTVATLAGNEALTNKTINGYIIAHDTHANTQAAHSWYTKASIEGLLIGNITTHTHSIYEPVVTKGNLTEATSSILTITGGTGAVIGNGISIQVKQASGSQSGYLSSTDWTTFNNKADAHSHPYLSNSTSSTQDGYFGDVYLYDDSTPSNYLKITNGANLTALRTLTLNTGDTSRTLTIGADVTLAHSTHAQNTDTGTSNTIFTIDYDNASTGVDTALYFNRGASATGDAALFWSESATKFLLHSDTSGPTLARLDVSSINGYTIAHSSHARSHAITDTNDHTAGSWKTFYSNGSGQIVELANSASGYVLTSGGAAGAPSWAAPYTHPTQEAITSDNSNGIVLQDITVNSAGHVTSVGTIDLDGRYYTETESNTRFAAKAHSLIDTTNHTVSGLTTGHVLRATGATTYAFGAIQATDVPILNQNTTGSAAKWTNSVTLSLTGSVTGSVSFDGSNATISMATTTNHTHSYLPLSGGILTGALTLSGDPTSALHAATKQWVESQIASGITWKESVNCYKLITSTFLSPPASPAVGDGYYINGTGAGAWTGLSQHIVQWNGSVWLDLGVLAAGFRALLTSSGTSGVFEGHANDLAYYNGTTWSFTDPVVNNAVSVIGGWYTGYQYVYTASGWTIFNMPSTITAGTGLTKSGNEISISSPVAVDIGGTGATTLTGVLKGNGTSAFTAMTSTANYVTYWSDANTISGITGNSGVLITSATGVPSIGTDIPTAVTIGGAYSYRVGGTDVAVADGGTGKSSWTQYGLVYASTTTALSQVGVGTAGQALLSGGSGAPSFGTLGLVYGGSNADLSGVATGGLIYKATSALAGTAALTGVLKGNGASAPSAMTSTTGYVTYWSDANTITGEQYLSVARGGTGLGVIPSGYIPFGSTGSALATDSNLFWDNTNNRLGLGIATPQAPLHIYHASSPNIYLSSTVNADNCGMIRFLEYSDGQTLGAFITYNGNSNLFHIGTNTGSADINAITIDRGTGNVGFNTVATNEKLEVGGYIRSSSGYKVGTTEVVDGSGNIDYGRLKNLPAFGNVKTTGTAIAKDANYTFGGTCVTGANRLEIMRDGIKQRIDTNSTAKDNDYWEVSTTQVRFNYNIPADSVVEFIIIPI